jgi:hypothetical protein
VVAVVEDFEGAIRARRDVFREALVGRQSKNSCDLHDWTSFPHQQLARNHPTCQVRPRLVLWQGLRRIDLEPGYALTAAELGVARYAARELKARDLLAEVAARGQPAAPEMSLCAASLISRWPSTRVR